MICSFHKAPAGRVQIRFDFDRLSQYLIECQMWGFFSLFAQVHMFIMKSFKKKLIPATAVLTIPAVIKPEFKPSTVGSEHTDVFTSSLEQSSSDHHYLSIQYKLLCKLPWSCSCGLELILTLHCTSTDLPLGVQQFEQTGGKKENL